MPDISDSQELKVFTPNIWIPSKSIRACIIAWNVLAGPLLGAVIHGLLQVSNHDIETPFDPATRVISIFAVLLNGLFSGIFFFRVGVRVAGVTLSPTIQWLISDANHSYQAWLLTGAVALVLDYTGLGLYIFPRAPLAEALAIMGGYPMVGYFFLKVIFR